MTVLVGFSGATTERNIAEYKAPILASGLSFKVTLIAGANSRCHGNKPMIVPVDFVEQLSLSFDLCTNNLLPESLAGGERHLHLLCEALCLDEMTLNWEQHRCRQEVPIDCDNGAAGLGDARKNRLG
jgi:hypothetical protein